MQDRLHMTSHPGTNPEPFTATVAEIDGDFIILSESYCYPRGGGQPGDRGSFNGNLGDSEFGEVLGGNFIRHPVDSPDKFSVGEQIECRINQEVRNRHAKMHTAQHIVSAMADDLWGAENREVYDSQILEDSVNEIIGSNTEVLVHDWSREKIVGHEQMRHTKFMDRIPSSIPTLRVVEIQGIDLCPCAGTHVGNTDDVESIVITNVKSKGAGKFRITYQFENELE